MTQNRRLAALLHMAQLVVFVVKECTFCSLFPPSLFTIVIVLGAAELLAREKKVEFPLWGRGQEDEIYLWGEGVLGGKKVYFLAFFPFI